MTAHADTPRWHALAAGETLNRVDSGERGLSTAEAKARLQRFGENRIAPERPEPVVALLARQLVNPLIVVLIAAGVLASALGELVDGAVVLGVVAANSVIGFAQEWRAGRAIQALAGLVPERATVLRDGRRATLRADHVVPGDIVHLHAGDRVPADTRLLSVRGLEIDEAPLTGESLPVVKRVPRVAADAPVADRTSMAHGGTLVTGGTATGVVVATGDETELGRVSELMRRTVPVATPLTRGLADVARILTVVICVVAAAMLGVALLRDYPFVDATLAAVALAVAAIPEGLPAIVTIALAVGVQRMARRRAVVRRLPAVETLGSTTVICTDKTGTLTRNEMAVDVLWAGGRELRWNGAGPADAAAERLLRGAVLCNDAVAGGVGPTEAALLEAGVRAGLDVEAERARAPRLDAIPFESDRKFMATLHAEPDGGHVIYLKGAPEIVLPLCADRAGAAEAVGELAGDGMRVLAVAARRAADGHLDDDGLGNGFELLGLAAMIDPPREEALRAVRACHEAGVRVKMITGDHVATARAIGARFGLAGPALTGRELDKLDDAELVRAARETTVFARVAPEHKLRLVRALQADGEVVAMTGDGVNDAPALKQADIGVAMGDSGTAAAREAADIVLTDDDFASIAAAVEEGRRVFDNVQKAIAFVLPTNLGEALIVLAAVLAFPFAAGAPVLPVEPTQILWINLIATVTLALPLALEVHEPGLMRRAPRRPGTPVIGSFLLARTVVVSLLMTAAALALFVVRRDGLLADGLPADAAGSEAQTVVVTTIVLFQVFYLLECRSLRHSIRHVGLWSNPWALAGIAAVLALQAAFIYAPPMQDLFGSAPLDVDGWLLALGAAATVLPVVGVEKWWRRRKANGPQHAVALPSRGE